MAAFRQYWLRNSSGRHHDHTSNVGTFQSQLLPFDIGHIRHCVTKVQSSNRFDNRHPLPLDFPFPSIHSRAFRWNKVGL